jgi:hypothetical protein
VNVELSRWAYGDDNVRDPARISRIMNKLKKLWTKYPDQRFTQLLINAGITPDGHYWNEEDDETENTIDFRLEKGF